MLPIISFVGKSESGKTTLLARIITILKQRGYKVAAIKHTQEFELEKEGKSSSELGKAGADTVIVTSPEELAIMKKTDHDLDPREVARLINEDIDLVLTEGFKKASAMKIEVHRKEQGKGLLVSPNQLLAVVTDEPLDVTVPQFDRDDIEGLTDLIEKWLLDQPKEEAELFVNDNFVPMNRFVKDFITKTLLGMVSTLNGINGIKSLRIMLRRRS